MSSSLIGRDPSRYCAVIGWPVVLVVLGCVVLVRRAGLLSLRLTEIFSSNIFIKYFLLRNIFSHPASLLPPSEPRLEPPALFSPPALGSPGSWVGSRYAGSCRIKKWIFQIFSCEERHETLRNHCGLWLQYACYIQARLLTDKQNPRYIDEFFWLYLPKAFICPYLVWSPCSVGANKTRLATEITEIVWQTESQTEAVTRKHWHWQWCNSSSI